MVSVKKLNRKRIPITIVIITVFLGFCIVSLAVTKLVYDGIFARYDEKANIPEELASMVQQRKVCTFPSGENQLTGYYYGTQKPEEDHGLILLVPGFCAGGDDYLWQIHELQAYGWGVFTFDTTGTLASQGESQRGFSQVIPDLEAALKYVEKQELFGYNSLVLVGHSRGAYAACCVLGENTQIAAVVSISGVNSAMEAIMQMSTNAIGPVSYGNYGFLWLYQALLFGTDTLEMDAAEEISKGAVPVLVVHGALDEKIPAGSSSIFSYKEQIPSRQVEYLLWDGGHSDLMYDPDGTANDALMADIHQFLLRCTTKRNFGSVTG